MAEVLACPRREDELELRGADLGVHEGGERRDLVRGQLRCLVPDHDPAVFEVVYDCWFRDRRGIDPPVHGCHAGLVPMRSRSGRRRVVVRECARGDVLATAVGLEDALKFLVRSGDDEGDCDYRHRYHDGAGERHDPPVEPGTSRGAHASGHGLLTGTWSTL